MASFRVAGSGGKLADVSVVPLPGLAGSDLDNVNRWRGQVNSPPVTQQELSQLAQAVEIGGQSGQLYEQAGETAGSGEKSRILAAISRRDGIAWFFKMTGDDALVSEQKAAFVGFLKSVTFGAPTARSELPPPHPPITGINMGGQGGSVADGGTAKPEWQVPSGWQEVPGGQFLVAKFALTGADNAQAAVNVSMSAGDGGGMLANINRWRSQLGLSPWTAADASSQTGPLDVDGAKATLVDMTGTDARTGQKTRLVAAMVLRSGQAWFYKLMGNEQIVGREKDAFTKFVQTAKYPNAS